MTPVLPYLQSQFERARPILFTGAGFSLSTMNILRERVSSPDDLKGKLWSLCFPGELFDQSSSLQHLFEMAVLRHKKDLKDILTASLTVDATSIPEWYRVFFALPWHKIYTLNIDDLELAAGRKFPLPRKVLSISSTKLTNANRESDKEFLRVIHLNGTIEDLVENVTFSQTQYAERLSRQEPVYVELASELLSHPFIFIGTRLEEPPLWQHVEFRFSRGGKVKELRPRSYLVVPSLDKAREVVVSQFNVDWLPKSSKEFAEEFLDQLTGMDKGFQVIERRSARITRTTFSVPRVSDMTVNPIEKTDFLLGNEPVWSDIHSGRAIERAYESALFQSAHKALNQIVPGLMVVTGTAGSGKTTSLMRLALRLSSEGSEVGWIGQEADCSTYDLRSASTKGEIPKVLILDDADLIGSDLASTVREIGLDGKKPLVIIGIRSGNLERRINRVQLANLPYQEQVMPLLTDEDIEDLIDILDRENRLGILKGKARAEQIRIFQKEAGRELLVATYQATSGEKFESKISKELNELESDSKKVYAFVAVASAFRFPISKKDILVALGDPTNTLLNRVDELVRRKIILVRGTEEQSYSARHRVIAEIIFKNLQADGELYPVMPGIALVLATQINESTPRTSRARKTLNRVVNHDFLNRTLGPEQARTFYADLESNLSFDAHFWLQRGSLEVEVGNIRMAENFLNQARGLAPTDDFIEAEYDYLLFKKALDNVTAMDAPKLIESARKSLISNIARRGDSDAHIYHIYCSQSLAWCLKAMAGNTADQVTWLDDLLRVIKDGIARHPYDTSLKSLQERLKHEYMSFAVK